MKTIVIVMFIAVVIILAVRGSRKAKDGGAKGE